MSPPPRPGFEYRLDRLLAALAAKGIVSEADLTERQAQTDRASPAIGAAMVARAWTDPEYRALLLRDGRAAVESMGASVAGVPPLGVLEDTASRHHLVVCTLCSCYPRTVLGYPPGWFKSFSYRSRAVRDPRGVLAEFGTVLPEGVEVRVLDSTADYRWMVLPQRPDGTEGWDAARLAALVDAKVLIGATLPRVPALA